MFNQIIKYKYRDIFRTYLDYPLEKGVKKVYRKIRGILSVYNHLLFLLYWIINALVIFAFGLNFSDAVVLGNHRLIPIEAAVFSGFWLTFFVWTMWDFIFIRDVKLEPAPLGFLYFFFVNSLGVWLVTRYAQYTGLGIVSFVWAFLIGVAANVFQRLLFRIVVERGGKIY